MKYILKMFYADGKDVTVILEEHEISVFLEKVNKNEPYWTNNNETAFWTPSTQVRYVNIYKQKEENEGQEAKSDKADEGAAGKEGEATS
jgi:hypothetical protein